MFYLFAKYMIMCIFLLTPNLKKLKTAGLSPILNKSQNIWVISHFEEISEHLETHILSISEHLSYLPLITNLRTFELSPITSLKKLKQK